MHGGRFCSSCGQALDELPTTTRILAVLVCMALAVYSFKVSLGGRPAFKNLLAET